MIAFNSRSCRSKLVLQHQEKASFMSRISTLTICRYVVSVYSRVSNIHKVPNKLIKVRQFRKQFTNTLLTSPKKQTDGFVLFAFLLFTANKSNLSVRFLRESTVRQFSFWFYLTFRREYF